MLARASCSSGRTLNTSSTIAISTDKGSSSRQKAAQEDVPKEISKRIRLYSLSAPPRPKLLA